MFVLEDPSSVPDGTVGMGFNTLVLATWKSVFSQQPCFFSWVEALKQKASWNSATGIISLGPFLTPTDASGDSHQHCHNEMPGLISFH